MPTTREQALEAALRPYVRGLIPTGDTSADAEILCGWKADAEAALALPTDAAPAHAGEHTPGPWIAGGQDGEFVMHQWRQGNQIAYDRIAIMETSNPQFMANRSAILALPSLLTAIRELLELAEGFDDADHADDGDEPIVAPILKRARAAIARATGRED